MNHKEKNDTFYFITKKSFAIQKKPLTKLSVKAQICRKYSQYICFSKDFCLEYIKHSYNIIRQSNLRNELKVGTETSQNER